MEKIICTIVLSHCENIHLKQERPQAWPPEVYRPSPLPTQKNYGKNIFFQYFSENFLWGGASVRTGIPPPPSDLTSGGKIWNYVGYPPSDLTSSGKIWNYRGCPHQTWHLVAEFGTTGDAPPLVDRQKYWKHYPLPFVPRIETSFDVDAVGTRRGGC